MRSSNHLAEQVSKRKHFGITATPKIFGLIFSDKKEVFQHGKRTEIYKSRLRSLGGTLRKAEGRKGRICEVRQSGHRPSKTHLNYNLCPRRGLEQIDFIRQRTTEARTLKRDDVNVMCSWVVTLPEYRHHNQNLHIAQTKSRSKGCSLSVPIAFSATATESRMSYRRMSIRTKKRRICTFFVPVTEDKKRGGEKVSAKEVITKNDLKTFHTDLERHLDSFRDWHFEVVNEATKDGNKEIAELKKQTAHEEVLKAQQEATQARQRALQDKRV